MKIPKLFFSYLGVMTLIFVIILNGWYLSTNKHVIKVINMNVFSEKSREIIRKSPLTLEEILNKVESPTISSNKKLTAAVAKNSLDASNEVMGKAKNERPMCSEKGSKLGMYFVQEMFYLFLYQARYVFCTSFKVNFPPWAYYWEWDRRILKVYCYFLTFNCQFCQFGSVQFSKYSQKLF